MLPGYACSLRWKYRNYGLDARKDSRRHHVCYGQFRSPRWGYWNQSQRTEWSIRIYGVIYWKVERGITRTSTIYFSVGEIIYWLFPIKQVGRLENVLGWYHSHPGYGCWLSGIDVSTQMLNQQYQEPFVAVVIDPNRTMSAGKVEIGAFRTYPTVRKVYTAKICFY